MAKKRKKYQFANNVSAASRKWLNPLKYPDGAVHGPGSIIWQVLAERGDTWEDVSLTISDCNRSIQLDLPAQTPQEKQQSLKKLDLMIDELSQMREALHRIEHEPYKEDVDS